MNFLKYNKVKKISSIPGRLRISVNVLKKNEQMSYEISNLLVHFKGIISAYSNKKTGNILIIYNDKNIDAAQIIDIIQGFKCNNKEIVISRDANNKSLFKNILQVFNPILLLKRIYPRKIYEREYDLSNKLIKIIAARLESI